MKIIDLEQGSDAWHQHRRSHRNASDSPKITGNSNYISRSEFIEQVATGVEPEHNEHTLARFEEGHRIEALARPLCEELASEDFYPLVGTRGGFSASFDGVSLCQDVICEIKMWNQSKADDIDNLIIPITDLDQIIHQFYVSEASKCLYVVTDGTKERFKHLWIERRSLDETRLLAQWQQFDADVLAYEPAPPKQEILARDIQQAVGEPGHIINLIVDVQNVAVNSNIDEFKASAEAAVLKINMTLNTDEDFAIAKKAVKYLKQVEDNIKLEIESIIGQSAGLNDLLNTLRYVKEELARDTRKTLDRQVKKRESEIRVDLRQQAEALIRENISGLNESLGKPYLDDTNVAKRLIEAMKGRRTQRTLNAALEAERAAINVDLTLQHEHIKASLAMLKDKASDHKHLFPDTRELVLKPHQDLATLIEHRIFQRGESERIKKEKDIENIAAALEKNRQAAATTEENANRESIPDNKIPVADSLKAKEVTHEYQRKGCHNCGSKASSDKLLFNNDTYELFVIECSGCDEFTALKASGEVTEGMLENEWNDFNSGF